LWVEQQENASESYSSKKISPGFPRLGLLIKTEIVSKNRTFD